MPLRLIYDGTEAVRFLLAVCKLFSELTLLEDSGQNHDMFRHFLTYLRMCCLGIQHYCQRIISSNLGVDEAIIARSVHYFESIVVWDGFRPLQEHSKPRKCGMKLKALIRCWDKMKHDSNQSPQLELLSHFFDFGRTSEKRSDFLSLLAMCVDDLGTRYPEDLTEFATFNFTRPAIIKQPSYAIRNAAKSIFNAFTLCQNCLCTPSHSFSTRLRLATYRTPKAQDYTADEVFDTMLSMDPARVEWHQARVLAKAETSSHRMGSSSEPVDRRGRSSQPMKVTSLCEPLIQISKKATYRLHLQVSRNELFKLQSQKRDFQIAHHTKPISLKHLLFNNPRAFTLKMGQILAVILSSTIFHLCKTPWLQPLWRSSHILFFSTTSSAIPLRPYIQAQLHHSTRDDDTEDDDLDPNRDPDDFLSHKCPHLIELAILLMELYFVTPYSVLASRYGVPLEDSLGSSHVTRYLDADMVFQACKKDIPQYSHFYYVVENCLDATKWEDQNGGMLNIDTLRRTIYELVVQPLEVELSQGYSHISIDNLDQIADGLDCARWGMPIETLNSENFVLSRGSSHPVGEMADVNQSIRLASQTSNRLEEGKVEIPITELLIGGPFSQPHSRETRKSDNTKTFSQFFDDEASSNRHCPEGIMSYTNWKEKYEAVYKKYIPDALATNLTPPRIAVLDTGIDLDNPSGQARLENIKGKRNWLRERSGHSMHDSQGHGTFMAGLILDYAPDAELYIAKIADQRSLSLDPAIIAAAIHHAVDEWKVDIISMSFGFPKCAIPGYDKLEAALKAASERQVLLFAAASNEGGQLGRAFPAREENVIAVHSTDTNGNRSRFSPTAEADSFNVATVGEAVESDWPSHLCNPKNNSKCIMHKSGTSCATAIIAGISAFLLLYARLNLPGLAERLKKQQRMKAVLRRVAEKGPLQRSRDGYYFVALSTDADCLFGEPKAFIDMTMQRLLTS